MPPLFGSPPLLLHPPPPPLLLAKTIFGTGALAGVFPCDDWLYISCDRCDVTSDGSVPWETEREREPERRRREMTSSEPAPSPGPLVSLSQGHGDKGGRGGGGNSLALHVGPTFAHCELESWRRHKTFWM